MHRTLFRLFALVVPLIFLCGCAQGKSLGERAIVKAVYVNTLDDGQVEAALVVLQCQPSSDTGSVTEKAKIYMGQGDNLEQALYQAERQQNKSAFYAQNQLLFLGPGAIEQGVSSYLCYFGQEDVGRLNLSVYLTTLDGKEFPECEEVLQTVIQEGERLTERNALQANPSQSIFEAIPGEHGESGWLPILDFSDKSDAFIGVKRAALFKDGICYSFWDATELQVALLLDGKCRNLSVQTSFEQTLISLETSALSIEKNVKPENGKWILEIQISGKIEHLSIKGKTVSASNSLDETVLVNRWLASEAMNIVKDTFYRQNDIFQLEWWLRMYDAQQVEKWKNQNELERNVQICIKSNLYRE